MSKPAWLALALIVCVAAFTHLTHLDLIDFRSDEAQIAGLVVDAVEGHWPAASIATSNGGLDNPPLPLYLFALSGPLARDPAWQAAVGGVLDVLAVLVTFAAGRRYFGVGAGLTAAACYAGTAYATIFARKLAGPFLQPVFAALLLWLLLDIAVARDHGKRMPWSWAGAVILLGVLVQLHLGALLLAPVLLVLLGLDVWWRRSWSALLPAIVGAVVAAASFGPYLAYEAAHRGDVLAMLGEYVQGTPSWTGAAFRFVWITLTSPGYGDLTGGASGLFNAESWPAGLVTPLVGVAALGGLTAALLRWRDSRYSTLAVFVLLPPLLTLHHGPGLQIHYFDFLLPALFLLAGIGFDAVVARARWLELPAFGMLGLLLAVNVFGFRHFTQFLERQPIPESWGIPLVYQERLFQEAAHLANGRRVVVGTNGRDEAEPARFFLRGLPNTEVDAGEGLLLPSGGGVLATFSRGTAAAHALDVAASPAFVEPLPGGASQAAAYELPAGGVDAVVRAMNLQTAAAHQWRNGVRLVGVSAPRTLPGQLLAAWRVDGAVDGSTVFFNQVVDDDGRQWFDRDSAPVPAADWRPGDGLLTFTAATLPSSAIRQEYWWSAGMYTGGGRRVLLDGGESDARLARLKGGRPAVTAGAFTPAGATFGGAIRLEGYVLNSDGVTLQWVCLTPVDRDFTVFVHALDAQGKVTAQSDAQPFHYPTSLWDPGEVVVDRHVIPAAPNTMLEVGLYDLASGQRLRLADGSDRLILQAAAR